jgi:hypothetical protein
MRYLLILAMLAGTGWAQTCEECPPRAVEVVDVDGKVVEAIIMGGTCGAIRPAGDGCNTCSFETWCINGQWYRSPGEMCTLVSCMGDYKIDNPFK